MATDKELMMALRAVPAVPHIAVDMVLVARGYKQATEVLVGVDGYKNFTNAKDKARAVSAVQKFCTLTGLYCRPFTHPHAAWKGSVWMYIGKNKKIIDRLDKLDPSGRRGALTLGRIYGFPESAARAYGKGEQYLMPHDNGILFVEPRLLRAEPMAFLNFRLSKRHWRTEVAMLSMWAKAIKDFDPKLYRAILKDHRARLRKALKKRA